MKRKLHFLLAVGIGLTTSVGWLHAADTHHVFNVPAGDVMALRDSIAKAAEGDTVKLPPADYNLTSPLVINKPIVIVGTIPDGRGLETKIIAVKNDDWPKNAEGEIISSSANLVTISGGASGKTVTLKNLCVMGSMASGINVQSAMKTVLYEVASIDNAHAGLLVHSTVEATNFQTDRNVWGGVNVDKGTPEYSLSFTFKNSTIGEPYKIWTEQTTAENIVTVPDGERWKTYTIKGSDKEKTKMYWVHSDLDMEYVEQFPRNTNLKAGYTFVYAKGAPITIQQSSNEGFISINNKDGNSLLELPEKCNPVIFGGSKEALEGNTSITMKSGRVYALIGGGYNANVKDVSLTVNGGNITQYLVGGGFGPNDASTSAKYADAAAVTMNVEGASVSYLISGGMEFSKVTSTNVTLNNATVGYALGGGFAPSSLGQNENTVSTDYFNSIGTSVFTMTGGVVNKAVCAGGGYSYSAMGTATATYNNVIFNGGLYGAGWRGYTGTSTVNANGCTFNSRAGDYRTIAAMVRGKAENISLTFDDKCTFDSQYECYLGTDRDSEQKNPIPTSDNITITFKGTSTPIVKVSDGMQNVTVTGAKVNVAPFLWKASTPNDLVKDFTIPSGKTWTFNDGLSMESGVKLTKNGTLKYGKSFDTNVATADELKAAVIKLADATYDLNSTVLEINKSMTIQGADPAKCIMEGAMAIKPASNTEKTIVAINGVKFDYTPSAAVANTKCTPVIEVHNGNVDLQVNNCLVDNNTAGTGGRTAADFKYLYNVFQMDSLASGSMIIENCVVNLNANSQIAVLTEAEKSTVLLKDTKIQTSKNADGTPKGDSNIGIFPHNNGVTVTMDNSTIELKNHYGIYLWSGDNSGKDEKLIEDLKVYLTNKSAISAYGAIRVRYTKNTYVSIAGGSTLTGTTFNAKGGSNDFGTLVMQGNIGAVVDIEDSNVGTVFGKENAAPMTPFLFNNYYGLEKGTIINLKGATVVQTQSNEKAPYMVKYSEYPDPDTLKSYVKVAEAAPVKFLDEAGNDCLIIKDYLDKSFRNAAVSIASAVAFGETYVYNGTTYYDFYPVAQSGDVVLAKDTTIAKVLLSLNNAKMLFFENTGNASDWEAYTIPDSLIFDCKDGYLVTGKNAADLFANSVTNKAVFYLKQTATEFTAIAAGNNHVQIKANDNVAWNVASNANRSVEIAAGATLTINVAMPLDTVFMAESAQLVANAAVTANAVQLTYGTTKVWKAFGFPFAIGSVKNVAGDKEIKTTASAKDGVWTAGIDDKEPKFTVTGENATPAAACIIASEKDSSIVVTSTGSTLSLATKAEPNAPVVTPAAAPASLKSGETVNFKIYSNPNLSDMTLTQTAYVLSDDGKTFDRMVNPTIKAFQSFVLADEATTSTLRSLRIGDTPTGNEIVPVEGYFVETGHGTITIHTAEPTQVIVVDMLGRVHYNARVNDGAQIAVPAGIYAVNRQKVIVK